MSTGRRVGRPAREASAYDEARPSGVREALLAATLRQLEASADPAGVTVTSVVTEAGCTPPSLYHYWPSRDLLLSEACERGWQEFRQSQAGADETSGGPDPLARIRERGRAYLAFALERPSLFRVLLLSPSPTVPESPAVAVGPTPAQGEALRDLVGDVAEAMRLGLLSGPDPLTVGLTLWSTVHGIAALWVCRPDLPADLAERVFEAAYASLLP